VTRDKRQELGLVISEKVIVLHFTITDRVTSFKTTILDLGLDS
jgi:hypothetical protein